MSFNLNNPIDAARATLSAVSNPAVLLADLLDRLRGRREWKIYEASYNGVKFHVFQSAEDYSAGLSSVRDQGGRRKAVYKFPYTDGQTTNDLGREGYSYSIECVFHGPGYKVGWNALQRELNKPEPGELIHPILGRITVVPKDWTYTHGADTRQAVTVSINFIEHNFTIGDPSQVLPDPTAKGALGAAIGVLNALSNAITTVQATVSLARSIRNSIAASIEVLTALMQGSLIKMNSTFNPNSGDTPEAVSISGGGVGETTNSVSVTTVDDDIYNDQGVILTTQQVIDEVNSYRAEAQNTLKLIQDSDAELDLYDVKLTILDSVNQLQSVAEKGLQSSKPRVIEYTLPRNMSLREVAYANGLSPDDSDQIDALNPTLESVNEVLKGTVLQVPNV